MNVPNLSLDTSHYPVMLREVIELCSPQKGGNFIDCTFGGGSYTKEILKVFRDDNWLPVEHV